MSTEQPENEKKGTENSATSKPDPETLHTTDPQEHMEGPLSSLMQSTDETFKEKGAEKGDE